MLKATIALKQTQDAQTKLEQDRFAAAAKAKQDALTQANRDLPRTRQLVERSIAEAINKGQGFVDCATPSYDVGELLAKELERLGYHVTYSINWINVSWVNPEKDDDGINLPEEGAGG